MRNFADKTVKIMLLYSDMAIYRAMPPGGQKLQNACVPGPKMYNVNGHFVTDDQLSFHIEPQLWTETI